MSNCGEYNFNMFIILPAYFSTLCNITTWGELVSESGEFHVGRVVLEQVVLCPDVYPKSVSPEVLDQEQFACIILLIFLIFLNIIHQ